MEALEIALVIVGVVVCSASEIVGDAVQISAVDREWNAQLRTAHEMVTAAQRETAVAISSMTAVQA